MKKKIYIQTSIVWHLFSLFILSLSVACLEYGVRLVIDLFRNYEEFSFGGRMVWCCLSFFVSAIIFKGFLTLESSNVHLREHDVYMPDDLRTKKKKLQYKTVTKYEDIADIKTECNITNSKGKAILSHTGISYLVLVTKKGRKNRYTITFFSRRAIMKIIDEIKKRMIYYGNNVELESTEKIMEPIEDTFIRLEKRK